jgi:hypothetical protein
MNGNCCENFMKSMWNGDKLGTKYQWMNRQMMPIWVVNLNSQL